MFVLLILVEILTITVKTLSFKSTKIFENIQTESESTNVNVYDDFNQYSSINYQPCQQNYLVMFY